MPDAPAGTLFASLSARDACFDELKLCRDSFQRTQTQLVADVKRVEADAKRVEADVRKILLRVATFDVFETRLLESLDEIVERHTSNKRARSGGE